uniref:Uncharacterized protein n=1 Tax=Plectus sambesii TaxID=2011161 RepID=A0A914V3S6_9BILA
MDRDDDRQGGRARRDSDCKWAIQADSRPSADKVCTAQCAAGTRHSPQLRLAHAMVSPDRRSVDRLVGGFEEIRLERWSVVVAATSTPATHLAVNLTSGRRLG